MLSVAFLKKKYNVKFKAITFRERQGGVNSINIPKIVKIGFKAIKDFYKFNDDEFNELTGKYQFKGQDVDYGNVYNI